MHRGYISFSMYIDVNKKVLKRAGAGILTLALVLGGVGMLRISAPKGVFETKEEVNGENITIPETEPTNWGLSFQKEGEMPVGNAGREELKNYNAYYCGNPEEKTIYLTFDAGFENGNTEKILDALKTEKVPAAFFCVGTYIKENPEIIKRMENEGHIVGNHTMTHPDMTGKSEEEFKNELVEVEKLYKAATNKEMKKYYRPPMGKFNRKNLKIAQEMGYKTVLWSLAYVDWYEDQQPTREEALEKLMSRTHNGAVILLHSTSKTNGKYLQDFIERWKEKGYKFKSIEQLN